MCDAIRELFADELKEGREQGIALAKQVFHLNASGKSIEEIALLCESSVEEVKEILED